MSDKITKLQEERAKVIKIQKDINDLAKSEEREFTADETTTYENADKDFYRLTDEIKAEEKRAEREEELERRQEYLKEVDDHTPIVVKKKDGEEVRLVDLDADFRYKEEFSDYRNKELLSTVDYRNAYNSFLVGGLSGTYSIMSDDERRCLTEFRALQSDNDTEGGFLVVPEQFIARLIQAKDNAVFVRKYGNVIPVPNAASLGAPSLDNDPADPTWTAEIATGSEDSSMNFGKRDLHPHPLAKRIKVSKKLLRVARMNVARIVRQRLAYKFGIVEENVFQNGNGSNQPLGVFTASNDGIGTGRDISTDNTTTAITADGLINAYYNQKVQYRRTSRWLFHRDAIKMIRKLKDGEGNYLWRPGLAGGQPDTILEVPFDESEYTPNTFTTGLYVGLLADWSYYWIADAMNMQIQVLTELYAETNQNGYIGRAETDGMPVLAEAFTRVKLG